MPAVAPNVGAVQPQATGGREVLRGVHDQDWGLLQVATDLGQLVQAEGVGAEDLLVEDVGLAGLAWRVLRADQRMRQQVRGCVPSQKKRSELLS